MKTKRLVWANTQTSRFSCLLMDLIAFQKNGNAVFIIALRDVVSAVAHVSGTVGNCNTDTGEFNHI